jgi:hypothetical protein
MKKSSITQWLAVMLFTAMTGAHAAETAEPSFDGLQRVPSKDVQVLYVKPGASLAQFKRVALLDCYVAFRKNWQRDRQSSKGMMIDSKDMEQIKTALADEFRKVFTAELEKGGYAMATSGAEDVMILRPAIIDLDVTAPDTMQPGRSKTFSASAGSMTLYLEVYDGATGEILARVVDPKAARDDGLIQWQTSVTNRAEASRIIGKWAALTRTALDRARQQ